MIKTKQLYKSEEGFAAIIVTLVIMTIIVLVTIGFFAVVNREQRSAIDRQLSTQAFYAAETGVNEAAKLIADGTLDEDIETCEGFEDSVLYTNRFLSDDDEVEYTCVLIERSPNNLTYDSVDTEEPTIILIKAVDEAGEPVNLTGLNINWQSEDVPDSISFPGSGTDFPDYWPHAAPVLRATLTPIDTSEGAEISREQLVNQTATTFLRPTNAVSPGGSTTLSFANSVDNQQPQGEIVHGGCHDANEPRLCSVTLDGMNGSEYLLTLRAAYHNANVFITGEAAGDGDVLFADQQAVVDATGRASDVLRRVQVRVPLQEQYNRPGFGIETSRGGGICKQYSIYPDGASSGTNECP